MRVRRCAARVGRAAAVLFFTAVVAQRAAGTEADLLDPSADPASPQKTPYDRRDWSSLRWAGCKPEHFRIALDVGHTPEAPGATSARGVKEYAFNLQLARRIQNELTDGGFFSANLVTVRGLGHVQLAKRTERANAAGTDLLLSIHHDDVLDTYHETWTYNGAPHIYSDRYSGYSLFVSQENRRFEESLLFAKLLGAQLAAHGLHYSAHHAEAVRGEGRQLVDATLGVYRYDQLSVLRFSASPAVLMEAGIIVNRKDELELASPEGQGRISAAVLAALIEFCTEPSTTRR
jgi:N-acetylmuramoyl-L-alanine amidase